MKSAEILAVIAVLGVALIGMYVYMGGGAAIQSAAPGAIQAPSGVCQSYGNSVEYAVAGVDKAQQTTSLSGVRYTGNIGSNPFTNDATASLTLTPGLAYDLVLTNTSYFSQRATSKLPCDSATIQAQLGKIGGIDATVKNADGTVNSGSNLQAVGTGQTVTFEVKLQNNASKTYSLNPEINKAYFCVDLEAGNYSKVDTQLQGATEVAVPSFVGTGVNKCWEITDSKLFDWGSSTYNLVVAARTGVDANYNISYGVIAEDYFVNTFSKAISVGVEDNTGSELTASAASGTFGTIYVS